LVPVAYPMDVPSQKTGKGVKLQGFKGFRLKSTQIVRKNSFSKCKYSRERLHQELQIKSTSSSPEKCNNKITISHNTNANDDEFMSSGNKNIVEEKVTAINHVAPTLKVSPIHGMLVASCKVVMQNEKTSKDVNKR